MIKALSDEHYQRLQKECERLYVSGALDTESAEEDYFIPKIVFHVALLNEAQQYKPLSKEAMQEVNNLKHF